MLRSTRNQCALSVMRERVALSVVYVNPTNVQVVQGRIDRYQIHLYGYIRNVVSIVQFLLLIRHAEKIAPLAATMDRHRRIFLYSVFKLMGCDCESSVRRLPCLDIRRQVVYAGNDEIDSASFCRIENAFLKGMKSLVHLLLPNLKLKSDLKNALASSLSLSPMRPPLLMLC